MKDKLRAERHELVAGSATDKQWADSGFGEVISIHLDQWPHQVTLPPLAIFLLTT